MSTVGNDLGYSSRRNVSDDLEQDYNARVANAKQRQEEREAKLEADLSNAKAHFEEENRNTVNNLRDRFESSLNRQKVTDQHYRDELQRNIYDRTGKLASQAEEVGTQRDKAISALSDASDHFKKQNETAEQYYASRAEEANDKRNQDMEALTDRYKKEIQELRNRYYNDSNTRVKDIEEKVRSSAQSAVSRAQAELQEEKKNHLKSVDAYSKQINNQELKNDKEVQRRLDLKQVASDEKTQHIVENDRASREEELAPLRDQIKNAAEATQFARKGWNEGRERALREYEGDHKNALLNMQNTHEREMNKLSHDGAIIQNRLSSNINDVIREKNTEMASKLGKQSSETVADRAFFVGEFQKNDAVRKHDSEIETNRNLKTLEKQKESIQNQYDTAFEKQTDQFKKDLSLQKTRFQSEVKDTEDKYQKLKNSDLAASFSLAAEEAVRKQVSEKYEKQYQADSQRNRLSTDKILEEHRESIQEAGEEQKRITADLTRRHIQELNQTRTDLSTHIDDLEAIRKNQISDIQQHADSSHEQAEKIHQKQIQDVHKQYSNFVAERDDESHYRLRAAVEDADFEKRQIQHEFSGKMQDTIRSYEKKLLDAKIDAQDKLDDLRKQMQLLKASTTHDSKKALDELSREYEHRLAEQESRFKERERVLAYQQQDELEKVKKANAQLLSKKG